MADVQGICVICSSPAIYICSACGKVVCDLHYNRKRGLCVNCEKGHIMNKFYTIKETNSGTVEIIPRKEIRLSIKNIIAKLMSINYELVTDTPFVVVMKKDEEVTLFPSGKLILKKLDSKEEIRKIVEEIYETILCQETIRQ